MALLISPSAEAQGKSLPPHRVSPIEVYESSEELHETLQEKPALTFAAARAPHLTITVNDAVKYQEMDGFGASLTDSSAWLLSQRLTPAQRTALLKQRFDAKQGIGLAILRQPMGSSDFSVADYSYDDMPPGESDPELKGFTIDRDRQLSPIYNSSAPRSTRRQSQAQNHRQPLEPAGLDENLRFHDWGHAAAVILHAACALLRAFRAVLRSGGSAHLCDYSPERTAEYSC